MILTIRVSTVFWLACLGLFQCGSPTSAGEQQPTDAEEAPSLGALYADNFYIGAAINRGQIMGQDTAALRLLESEFTSITPENIMKWENIQPGPDSFTWEAADAYVALGEEQDKWIIGHTLVWHSQAPAYVNETTDPEQLRQYMEEHIRAVAGRYAGRIDGWDVLNEALNEDGSYRESIFYRLLGEQYILDAYRIAAEAAPDAELYYNDYNLNNPQKRTGAVRIVNLLKENGLRIDGVGMQGHYNLNGPPIEEVEASIEAYAATGAKVMITELDLTTLPNPWDLEGADVNQNFEGSEAMNPYAAGLPDSVSTKIAERYADLFRLFLKHDDAITRVTLWGINDAQSWLNNWPIRGRTNYPLLFDRASMPKEAYGAVVALKQ
ncbi:endo-1,4-beta-xylanase [Neolewinella xylanilytica]|uniref:Beta-xylanase n=1 Tax=Neolewinella xylanilytica TaxID=1514080 RepID=A0A2S6I3X9_9BACT|nr:endo-1,4-beta-xylanase [Neolewinella xylanilytica]PPK85870.1 endo-1,4-beta-xylanase [Neolewinella xylanilytica]